VPEESSFESENIVSEALGLELELLGLLSRRVSAFLTIIHRFVVWSTFSREMV